MENPRKNIENRIFEIVRYTKNESLEFLLNKNLNLFSKKELETILSFLETWDLWYIYKFLDEKYKEYLSLIEQVKQIKINNLKQNKLLDEKIEKDKELEELEQLLNF